MPIVNKVSTDVILAALTEPPFKQDDGKTYLMFDQIAVTSSGTKFFYKNKLVFSVSPADEIIDIFGCIPFTIS